MKPHEFWQDIFPPGCFATAGGHDRAYPATLADGRQIVLPIRPLADGRHALASLIINQASFAVVEALADDLVARLAPLAPDIVVGLPTLGLTLAAETARRLGHRRYVPLGTSRKFWYEDALSVPLTSITTPDQVKRLYIDPRMLPLIEGRRVALVDDVISSGASMRAALRLLGAVNVAPVVIGSAMLQSERWRVPPSGGDDWTGKVRGCFETPLLTRGDDGLWYPPDGWTS